MGDWVINNMGEIETITLDDDVGLPGIVDIESSSHNPSDINNFTCISYTLGKEPNFRINPTLSRVNILQYTGKQILKLSVQGLFFDSLGESGNTYDAVRKFIHHYELKDPFSSSATTYLPSARKVSKITIGDVVKTEYLNSILVSGEIKGNIGGNSMPVFYTTFQFLVEK